jgi:hypothetical protein
MEVLAAPRLAGGIDADPGGLGRLAPLLRSEVVPEQVDIGVRGRMKDPLGVEARPLDIYARREERILEGSLSLRGEPQGEEDRGHEVGGKGQVCQDSCDLPEGVGSSRPFFGLGEASGELEAGEGGLVAGALRGQAMEHLLQKGDRRLPLRSGPVDPSLNPTDPDLVERVREPETDRLDPGLDVGQAIVVADLDIDPGKSLKGCEKGVRFLGRFKMRQRLAEGEEGSLGFKLIEEKPALRQAQVGQFLVAPELLGDRRRSLEQGERLIYAPLVPPQRRPGAAQGDSRLQGQRLVLKLRGGLLQKILGHLRPTHLALDLGEEHRGDRPQLPASGRLFEPIEEEDAETGQVPRPTRIFVQVLPRRRDQDLGKSQSLETALAADRRRPLVRCQAEQLVKVSAILFGFLPALSRLCELDRPEQDSLAHPWRSFDSRDQATGVEPSLGRTQVNHQT